MQKLIKVKSITILGRRWFQKTYGNTYHTAEIFVNGQRVHKTEEQYGYGEQYMQTAQEWLEKFGYIPKQKREGYYEPLFAYRDRGLFELSYSCADVRREKDL